MRVALWTYIAAYGLGVPALFLVAAFITPAEGRDPFWEEVADVVMYVVGLVGMFLYALPVELPWLKQAWQFIAPAFVLGHVWLFCRGPQSPPDDDRADPWLIGTGFGAAAFLAPCAVLNLLYAFQ